MNEFGHPLGGCIAVVCDAIDRDGIVLVNAGWRADCCASWPPLPGMERHLFFPVKSIREARYPAAEWFLVVFICSEDGYKVFTDLF